ncbi:putative transcriptional regulatory protein C56F2.05c [Ceratocystis lukuohia]|uniref:Transcriptional regulatory protein C56F2.05c n=1 Tax=Ceratocystis lukuohia TaxID=2019550 RepID=A0ABR4MGL9_9PEZI
MASPELSPGGMEHGTSNISTNNPESQRAPSKSVAFELLINDGSQYRARLPMRVQIYPHDATESIVTTVKNFYGLYAGPTGSKGVSFEDEQGNTLIASFENFKHNMVVYVRVIEEAPHYGPYHRGPEYYGSERFPLQPPAHLEPAQKLSRSNSPASHSRRSASAATNRSSGNKKSGSRFSSSRTNYNQNGDYDGYSSEDGSTSTKARDQIGNTEISLDNIVEGGRRRKAKFESSELPLFAPPQMPAAPSNSSVSPTRRMDSHRNSISFSNGGQNPFTNTRPLQSPQSYGYGPNFYGTPSADTKTANQSLYGPHGTPNGMAPTPDPTVGSCISDEDKDVAMQLMRLGDVSNISNVSNARTSASTQDDTYSGQADQMSSTGATSDYDSDGENGQPPVRRQRLDEIGSSRPIDSAAEIRAAPSVDAGGLTNLAPVSSPTKARVPVLPKAKAMAAPKAKGVAKTNKAPKVLGSVPKSKKTPAIASIASAMPGVLAGVQMSPSSLPPSRKQSISSLGGLAPGDDEHPDLSTKPRCQRCRKSKKGCDRQRPCGRCRDAGLSADQCISEDEGNGRKGRYGRHMGVPIKKEDISAPPLSTPIQTPVPIPTNGIAGIGLLPPASIETSLSALDKNKKRKR